ncbi:MAG: S8 family serine peptidase [Candidatus Enteromonas sp.]
MKKNLLASFALFAFGFATLPSVLTDPAYLFERDTGGTYLGEVPEEYRGAKAKPMVKPTRDDIYEEQKNYSMSNLGDIESVWDDYTGKGVKIAVIDDGFSYTHEEYKRADGTSAILEESAYFYANSSYTSYGAKYYKNDPTCIDEAWNSDYREWDTHGTNTSTCAMAPMNNGGGVGIAPDADLLALKVDLSFIAMEAAMEYAIAQGVDVINMSLGAYGENFTDGFGDKQEGSSSVANYLEDVCKKAYNSGIIVVAAAGNEATNHASYPACNSHVIGVGALDQNSSDTLAPFTNYNKSTPQKEDNVDILAPGFVYTAGVDGTSSSYRYNSYIKTQGTSFSSPIVAGAAALWKEKNPDGTPDEFLTTLQTSAANVEIFENQKIDTTSFGGPGEVGPSNITCGILDVGALMDLEVPATGLNISKTNINLSIGGGKTSDEVYGLIVPSNSTNRSFLWSVDHPEIASISKTATTGTEKVTITAHQVGDATLTCTTEDGEFIATASIHVGTYTPVTGMKLVDAQNGTSASITLGDTLQLFASTIPENASNQDFIVDSDNPSIATVDNDYLVTAKAIGQTDIRALIYENDEYIETTYHVEVKMPDGIDLLTMDVYNPDTMEVSDGKAVTPDDVKGAMQMHGVQVPDVLRSVSSQNAYLRRGGIGLASGSKDGYLTLNFDSSYPILGVNLVGAIIDTSGAIDINGLTPTGSLNGQRAKLENCSEILSIMFDSPTSSVTFSAKGGRRAAIYKAEFLLPGSEVEVESLSLDQHALTIDPSIPSTATLKATLSPSNASGEIVWSSSDETIATVNNGVVTGLKAGQATITASVKDHLEIKDTCVVTVLDAPAYTGLRVEGLSSTYPFASTPSTDDIKVKVIDEDGTAKDITSNVVLPSIDTSTLGNHDYVVAYQNGGEILTAKTTYFVTLKGASIGEGSASGESRTSTTFTNASWSDANNQWTSGKAGNMYLNSGVQVTAGTSGANATSKDSFSNVTKVIVHYCTNDSKGAGSIAINVGSASKSLNVTNAGGTTSRDLTFDFDQASGNVKITVNCITNSIYVQGVEIVSSAQGAAYDATPLEAAKAYAAYFLASIKPSCDPTGQNSDLAVIKAAWSSLNEEYGYLPTMAKALLLASDDALIQEMVTLYSILLKYDLGEDFLDLASGVHGFHGNELAKTNEGTVLLICLLGFALLLSIFAVTLISKKKRYRA